MYSHHPAPSLSDARDLFRQKAFPEALELCEKLLTRSREPADVLTLKALIHQQSGNLEEAGKAIELALTHKPDHAVMLYTAALINRKLKNYELAKKQAMKSMREAPDNAHIICQCALILGSVREPKYALQQLEKFTHDHPGEAQAWYIIGKLQHELANEEAAEFALRKCLKLQPDHANATKVLALIT